MRRRDFIAGLALAAAPLAARAQKKVPVVGVLHTGVNLAGSGFQKGLSETGFIEGENLAIDYRVLVPHEELPAVAADLVRRKVDVIAAFESDAARAAKRATATIPIVFESLDPVLEGLVASLARPGGNLTGVSLIDAELMPKRLQFLSELVPQAKVFALLVNPNAAAAAAVVNNAKAAARARGIELHVVKAGTYREVEAVFATLYALRIDALLIDTDPLLNQAGHWNLPALALRHGIPSIYGWSGMAWAGGLVSYGPSLDAARRQMGVYAGKILKGATPEDLPVVQPDKFELVINLKTAKALGLKIPPLLLAEATEVIR
jgi:ABC-type uncharacterized transport system substrate-binding protein